MRLAFKMKLHPNQEKEYQIRHDTIWPELKALLKESGIEDYSIFLDPHTLDLIGIMRVRDAAAVDKLPDHPVMKKWWAYMKDIMDTNADHSPVSVELREVFYLE